MKLFSTVAAALLGCAAAFPASFNTLTPKNKNGGTNYAVLVAGSNTWGNYRHQADTYHAYQILLRNGFSADQIILMHYDDIANNPSNPKQGVVINKPGGDNNYVNIPKEYVGQNVTPKNFLAIISGNAANATGRVLKTNSNDNIFINYSDHGSTGLVAMPAGGYLYATDLNNVLSQMVANKQFNEMVIYLEACESGSMFDKILPTNTKIYAHTASNAVESSYACYYDDELKTYVGDLWSVNWMEDTDAKGTSSETLQQQYEVVKEKTDLSHASQYGDLTITPEITGDFMAQGKRQPTPQRLVMNGRRPSDDAVSSRDVKLAILRNIAQKTNAASDLAAVRAEELSRQAYDDSIMSIAARVAGVEKVSTLMTEHAEVKQWDCYKSAIETYESKCRKFDDYGLKWGFVLNNLCNEYPADSIRAAIHDAC